MGTKAVELILGDNKIKAKDGDTLISSVQSSLQDEVNKQILPLKIKTEDLIGSIDSVMKIITAVLNKDTRNNLSNSLNSLDLTFNLMSETMFKVNGIIDENDERITSIFKNLEKSNHNITSILSNLSNLSNDLANSNIKQIITDLNAISQKINSSEGSLGLLINNKDIYHNLEKSTKALEDLIDDIKNNPKRYVSFSIIGSNSHLKK
jgi:phospholipid/cholesterol/gamma-HCH transport system substrate-binding protein